MKKKNLIPFILCSVVCVVGCKDYTDPEAEQIITSKTQLYISNYNGGYGDSWLKSLETQFEEKYANVSFEEGKTGVQVIVDNNKKTGNNLITDVPYSNNNVYFCESVFYYDFLNAGVMADLTDVVNEDLSDLDDTGTILDKYSEQQKEYYTTSDGKVYGIPHYQGFFGITYDLTLWENKKLYIAADNTKVGKVNALYDEDTIVLCRNNTQKKSNGPDGVAGTSDDGFPATYKELKDLMYKMEQMNITPFTWTGKYQQEYNSKLMAALATDYEGPEQAKIMFEYKGEAKNLVKSFDSNGYPVFENPTQINNANAYMTFRSAGRYYALQFMSNIVKNMKYYDSRAFEFNEDHLAAQQTFLLSYPERSISGSNAIAMFPEGNYWENEANNSGTFDFASQQYGEDYSRENRRLAMIAFPKATDELVGEKTTLLGVLNSLCFVNKNCDAVHLDLAKKFVKLANTNASLAEFNVLTNAPKALNYTLTDEQVESLNCYGKSVYELYSNSNVVNEISSNSIYASDVLNLASSNTFITDTTNNPVKEMAEQGTSYGSMFTGIGNYFNSTYWDKYNSYF